jgi:nicotinate-nucleotide pyrophosphorylase (carboxylating)
VIPPPDFEELRRAVETALAEDLGDEGDVTSLAMIPAGTMGAARLVAREELVAAGLPVARQVFATLDRTVEFDSAIEEGQRVARNTTLASLRGPASSLLSGERTALNFLMRMCGIATAARAAVDEIAGTGARILDTRKTAPGLRRLDKYAVAAGGAQNHRMGLYDAVMIKDTHLGACPSIPDAVRRALQAGNPAERITVEVRDLRQLDQAIDAGAGRVLLDNMDLATMREAVGRAKGRLVLEASGGLAPGRLREVALTGVDDLSLGCLTHSVRAADVAMEMDPFR